MSGDLSNNLSRSEFACHCDYDDCNRTPVDFGLVRVIQDAIDHFTDKAEMRFGHKFERVACHINSGYRCIKHNEDVTDGKSGSGVHTLGMAGDIWMEYVLTDGTRKRIPDEAIADVFEYAYPNSCGIGRYPRDDNTGRTHIDVRPDKARWTA